MTRSGLFLEAMRIIREMREATNGNYPKIALYENVFGAFSSNNGDDFFTVLDEFCGLIQEKLPTFRPASWSNSGEILAESGSIAWRTLNAMHWGVPQRRRRIFAVVDFRGQSAGEILFKPESLRRYTTPGNAPGKDLPKRLREALVIQMLEGRTLEQLTQEDYNLLIELGLVKPVRDIGNTESKPCVETEITDQVNSQT